MRARLSRCRRSGRGGPRGAVRTGRRSRERAVAWAIAAVDAAMIDYMNIYQASRMAMRLAVNRLRPQPEFVLVDAVPLDLAIPQQAVIKGDAQCHSIAAASIVAKVYRDRCMRAWDEVFPEYGLAAHKGYATPEHRRAIQQHGLTPLHRLSFEPVRVGSVFPLDAELQLDTKRSRLSLITDCPEFPLV